MPTTIATVEFKRQPRLYYIDKEGDISSRPRAKGHTLGSSGRPRKEIRLGIPKRPGHIYFLRKDPADDRTGRRRELVQEAPMYRYKAPRPRSRTLTPA